MARKEIGGHKIADEEKLSNYHLTVPLRKYIQVEK